MAIITGTSGSENLRGTKFEDTISGLGGNDNINGLASNDTQMVLVVVYLPCNQY